MTKMLITIAIVLASSASFAATCREGSIQRWPTRADNESGIDINIGPDTLMVCRNGSYVKAGEALVSHHSCNEGSIEMFPDDSVDMSRSGGESASAPNVPYICRNGRFVNQYHSSVSHSARAVRCPEGLIQQFPTGGGDGGPSYIETYVCKNGKMRHVSTKRY
jgi:hypothetical protein